MQKSPPGLIRASLTMVAIFALLPVVASADTRDFYTSQLVSPADSTTYYTPLASVGQTWGTAQGSGGNRRYFFETVIWTDGMIYLGAPPGFSTEDLTYSLYQGTSNTLICGPINIALNTWQQLCNGNDYMVPAGSYITLGITTPAWATNPTQMAGAISIYSESSGGGSATTTLNGFDNFYNLMYSHLILFWGITSILMGVWLTLKFMGRKSV